MACARRGCGRSDTWSGNALRVKALNAARGNSDLSLDVTDRRHDFRARPSLLCESLMSGDSAHQRAEQSRPLRLGSWFRVMLAAVGLVNLS
jgi:hypothetical protein